MRVTNEELAQWLKDTPTGLESGKLNFDQIRTYDIGLDLRDSRERVERLVAALIEQEWASYSADGSPMCGWCGAQPFDDEDFPSIHADDCFFENPVIRAALAHAEPAEVTP